MKIKIALVFLGFYLNSLAQGIVPFMDFNNFLSSYENGFFRQIEIQPISNLKTGDELAAYLDLRGNLRLYDGKERRDITLLNATYEVSDHILAYMIAGGLKAWVDGKNFNLTSFASEYAVKDSLVVFLDGRTRSTNVFWNKQSIMLANIFDKLEMPEFIGDNLVIYKDASQTYNVFWKGRNYEIGLFNQEFKGFPGTDGRGQITFSVGCDVFCFNDPFTQSFVVFEDGEMKDIESLPVQKFMAARGFVAYEDINGNLWHYRKGVKTPLSNFGATKWMAKDDLVTWVENSYFFAYSDGVKTEVANYSPQDFQLKNNILAFRNILGGVDAFVDGKVVNITNQLDSEYMIFGNKVLTLLPNKSAIVYENGTKYSN
ncbi:MAG: hypothetical protein FJZ66_03920 [Bacteroidetes bacterium]|nr:hypothetical protein [Bacteroidota bacterium]